jgi:hypothetical protein
MLPLPIPECYLKGGIKTTRTFWRNHCDLGSHKVRNHFTNIALTEMQNEFSSLNFMLKYVRSS